MKRDLSLWSVLRGGVVEDLVTLSLVTLSCDSLCSHKMGISPYDRTYVRTVRPLDPLGVGLSLAKRISLQ